MSSFISRPSFPIRKSQNQRPRKFNLYAKDLVYNGIGGEFQSNVPQNHKGGYSGLNVKGEFWLNKAQSRKDDAIEFKEYCFGKAIEFKQNQHVNIDFNDLCVVGLCIDENGVVVNSCVTSPLVFYGENFVLTHTGSVYKLGEICPIEKIFPKVISMYHHIKPEYRLKYSFLTE
jgi:hypothetical protein